MNKRIAGVMFGKFNNRDKRGRITIANKKGVSIIDRPFKDVLAEEMDKTVEKPPVEKAPYNPMDELFIWQSVFDKRRRGL